MRIGVVQLTATDDPQKNLVTLTDDITALAKAGADLICTPEVSNCVSMDRDHQRDVLTTQGDDKTLIAMCDLAAELKIWLSLGSLALKSGDADDRFVNRSFLITPNGDIAAQYDKIHMFDVTISDQEHYRESSAYRAGDRAVMAQTPLANIGLTICYDMRFPQLYADLALAGAQIILVPSAFTVLTGRAHFEALLRARAIETGCFIVAACQTGDHNDGQRQTWGHSTIINPWGEVLLKMNDVPGTAYFDIDLKDVDHVRARIPNLQNQRDYKKP